MDCNIETLSQSHHSVGQYYPSHLISAMLSLFQSFGIGHFPWINSSSTRWPSVECQPQVFFSSIRDFAPPVDWVRSALSRYKSLYVGTIFQSDQLTVYRKRCFMVSISHRIWLLEKPITQHIYEPLSSGNPTSRFKMLSALFATFASKGTECLLISWLRSFNLCGDFELRK